MKEKKNNVSITIFHKRHFFDQTNIFFPKSNKESKYVLMHPVPLNLIRSLNKHSVLFSSIFTVGYKNLHIKQRRHILIIDRKK